MRAPGFPTFGLALVLSASIVSIANAGQHVWTDVPSPIRATAQPGSCEHLSLHYPGGGEPLNFCGTLAEFVHEVPVCRARYEALTDEEQQSVVGMKLHSRCEMLQRARDGVIAAATARQDERQRIEDAHRQLRALGAEQPR
jgi:hypothetical protein